MPPPQYSDLTVSKGKFDREIAEYRALEPQYRKRGWLLIEAMFPRVVVVFAAPLLKPIALVLAVEFDYTNYDAAPPSVRLIHPLTGEPYAFADLPTPLMRALPEQEIAPQLKVQAQQALMQAHAPTDVPFLCLPGVREYHEHPAHTGDAWELHRAGGAGRLVRLLEVIAKYGIEPISSFSVQLTPKIGLNFNPPPA